MFRVVCAQGQMLSTQTACILCIHLWVPLGPLFSSSSQSLSQASDRGAGRRTHLSCPHLNAVALCTVAKFPVGIGPYETSDNYSIFYLHATVFKVFSFICHLISFLAKERLLGWCRRHFGSGCYWCLFGERKANWKIWRLFAGII